jgi:uncharacterized damage-inducible protein DinB
VRKLSVFLLLILPLALLAQDSKQPPTTLRGVLLEQLRTTHAQANWFVPANAAVAGLTADQAKWTPGPGNHSAGQLAYHIWYWDDRVLKQFKGEKVDAYDGNNNETFENFTPAQWDELVKKLDKVLTDWETTVQSVDDEKLAKNASLIATIASHNAYHIGQILYVRKLHGVWDPEKGVK